ncbi:MAG: alpha-E domain-containing protein, partial [Chthoniobacterales bacterium]
SGHEYHYDTTPRVALETRLPANHVTSRVAESFYWIGRYLERARNLAGMISVIEALETEELNPTERMHYRPVWNRMLPPLDGERSSRRTISSAQDRYRLTLDLEESGAVIRAVQHATWNGESVLECLSLEAWGVLSKLRNRFELRKFRAELPDEKCAVLTRSLCNDTTDLVAQFFGTAQTTMIADGGWSFCEVGEAIERAITTAHALTSMMKSLVRSPGRDREHAREIQMSAFLRLLSCCDVYRRVYQMRIESGAVLQMLWQNPMVPRSVTRCMQRCLQHIDTQQNQPSAATTRMVSGIETLLNQINQVDWERLAELEIEDEPSSEKSRPTAKDSELLCHLQLLLEGTQELHHIVTDGFLNHQIHMRPPEQPLLEGFGNAV